MLNFILCALSFDPLNKRVRSLPGRLKTRSTKAYKQLMDEQYWIRTGYDSPQNTSTLKGLEYRHQRRGCEEGNGEQEGHAQPNQMGAAIWTRVI